MSHYFGSITTIMRFTSTLAALVLLMSPVALADSGETTITVTSSFSTTLTVTKTLTYAHAANATTSHSFQPTGWNATSSSTTATTVNKATLTPASNTYSASPTIASVTATGAADSQEIDLAVAAMAGAAALIWGSL